MHFTCATVSEFLCIPGSWPHSGAKRLNKLHFTKSPNHIFQKWFRNLRAKIWEWDLSIPKAYHFAVFCVDIQICTHMYSPTQKFLLCFWKCHPKHTLLWKPCSGEGWFKISEYKLGEDRPRRTVTAASVEGQMVIQSTRWLYKAPNRTLMLSLNYQKLSLILILHMREDLNFAFSPG